MEGMKLETAEGRRKVFEMMDAGLPTGESKTRTELGDRFREFAALCDDNPQFVAAGIIARPKETIVATFVETQERDVEIVARGLYHACQELPENPGYFAADGETRYG